MDNQPLIIKQNWNNISAKQPILYSGNNFYANTLNLPNALTLEFYLNQHKIESYELQPNYEINLNLDYDQVVIKPSSFSNSINPATVLNGFNWSGDGFFNIIAYNNYIYTLNTNNSTISQYDYYGNLINFVAINGDENSYSNFFFSDAQGNVYIAIANSYTIYKYSSNLILVQTLTLPLYLSSVNSIMNISVYNNYIFINAFSSNNGYPLLYKYDLNFNLIWVYTGNTISQSLIPFVVIDDNTVLLQIENASYPKYNYFLMIQNGAVINNIVLANPNNIYFVDIGILFDPLNQIYYFISENANSNNYPIYIYDINFNLIRTLLNYSYYYDYPLMSYILDLNNDLILYNNGNKNLIKYNYQSDSSTTLLNVLDGNAVTVNSSNNVIVTYYTVSSGQTTVDILKNAPIETVNIPNSYYPQALTLILSCVAQINDNNYYRQLLINTENPSLKLLDVTNSTSANGITTTYSNESGLIKAYINFNNYNPTSETLTILLSNFKESVGIEAINISPYSPTITNLSRTGLTINLNGSNILLNGSIILIGS